MYASCPCGCKRRGYSMTRQPSARPLVGLLAREALSLPPARRWERLPDPKEVLYQALRTASGARGRRARRFNPGRAAHRLADLITDWSPLRNLAAFNRLGIRHKVCPHATGRRGITSKLTLPLPESNTRRTFPLGPALTAPLGGRDARRVQTDHAALRVGRCGRRPVPRSRPWTACPPASRDPAGRPSARLCRRPRGRRPPSGPGRSCRSSAPA